MIGGLSDDPVLTHGPALLVQPDFKDQGPANINSREASAGAGRQSLAYRVSLHQTIDQVTHGALGSATDTRAAQGPFFRTFRSALSQYLTRGENTRFSIAFVLTGWGGF